MPETEQTLSKSQEKCARYDKRLKACIDFLFGSSSYEEKEVILEKARHDFMFYLDLYPYQIYEVAPEDALDYAIITITRDRRKSREAISACSLFRITLKSCLYNCQQKIGYMVRKTA